VTAEVLRAGLLTTVQDLGRPGYAALGVPRSGALDAPALRLANRLVGNPEGAAALESTLTGCALRCAVPVFAAVTGAPGPVTVDGRPVPFGAPFAVPAGAVVELGAATTGLRGYLAVSGGFTVAPVLGSRSTDTLSGLGPPPLRTGDRLPLGVPSGPPAPVHATPARAISAWIELRLRRGPRDDWFTEPDALLDKDFSVSPTSNRVGARLLGEPLTRARSGELASEGMVLGAVQVPPDGLPVVFLADHPTTGGYPVIGVVHPDDLALLAQARPGTIVRFRGSQR